MWLSSEDWGGLYGLMSLRTTLRQDNRQSSSRPTTYTIENLVKRFINKSNEFNLSLTERFLFYIFLEKENFF